MGVSEEKLFVRDGRAMSKAPFWHKNFCLEMFEDRQTRPFETRIWFNFVASPHWHGAAISICCLEKLPTSQLIFPDSLLSFLLLSPFGGRGIVHFGYYLATLVTKLQLLLRQPGGRMVLRETE